MQERSLRHIQLVQSIQHQVRILAIWDGISHNLTIIEIHDRGQVEFTVSKVEVGHVCDKVIPLLEQSGDGTVAVDKLISHTDSLYFFYHLVPFFRLLTFYFPTVESGSFDPKTVQNDWDRVDFLVFFHQLDKTYFVDDLTKLRYFFSNSTCRRSCSASDSCSIPLP